MRLILLGAPGAGKGTQAANISEKLAIPVISTGNIIRREIDKGSALGEAAKRIINEGNLLPDSLVNDMVRARLNEQDCANGFILDGFPRKISQAKFLEEENISIDKVISIEVSDEDILDRMTGRRVCRSCGKSYHIEYNAPKAENICDDCGCELSIRPDDKIETVKNRLEVYHNETEPLKDYYVKKGILSIVFGCEKVEDTVKAVNKVLEA
ncbi:MAG: adenylate kinase [Clostridia bacterium]|nr:adenylate kinase [Clostridia bacterium]